MENARIILPKTTLDYTLEILSLLAVSSMIVLFLIIWIGNTFFISLFMLVFLAVSTYAGMTILNRFVNKLNYPIKVTDENRQALYILTLRMVRWIKLLACLLFANIGLGIFYENKLNIALFIILIVGMFFVMWYYILKMFKMQWNKTTNRQITKSTTP
jgi:hypothetical protein